MQKSYLLKRLLLDLFYPNRCGFCGEHIPFNEYFCDSCGKRSFSPYEEKDTIKNIDSFFAVTVYDRKSRQAIKKMKRENNGYALSAIAYLMYLKLDAAKALDGISYITYIPMGKKDLNHRGYNQSKLIAKELAGLIGIKSAPLLKKVKETKEQKTLGAAERRKNLKNAFAYSGKIDLNGKNVLIVDDVCTTGSTISEAAITLKNAGAKQVGAAVFAKTVLKT